MVAWGIWHNWNEVCQGNMRQEEKAVPHKARFLLDEFQTANFSMAPFVAQDSAHWEALLSP